MDLMTVIFEERFSGLDEEAITTANTGFTSISGVGTAVADTAVSVADGVSARIETVNDGDLKILQVDLGQTAEPIFFGWYFMPLSYPMAAGEDETNLSEVTKAGDGIRAMMEFGSDGTVRLKDFNVLTATSVTALPLNRRSRVEWKLDSVNDIQTCRLFVGTNLHGSTPDEEFTGDLTTAGEIDRLRVGNVRNTLALTAWWDTIVAATDWPGAHALAPQVFTPPITHEAYPGSGILFERFTLPRGITVIERQDRTFYQTRFPAQEELEDSRRFWLGGYEHEVDNETALNLIDAGYEENVSAA